MNVSMHDVRLVRSNIQFDLSVQSNYGTLKIRDCDYSVATLFIESVQGAREIAAELNKIADELERRSAKSIREVV